MKGASDGFSNAFLIAALLLAAAALSGLQVDPAIALALLVASVVLLGLPHGALDPLVARSVFPGSSGLTFYLLYSLASAFVVLLWIASPALALGGFLAISAYHFGSDLSGESPVWLRICYGSTILALPCVLHGGEVGGLYRMLAGPAAVEFVAPSRWIAAAAGIVTLSAMLRNAKAEPRRAAEAGVILVSGMSLPPLLFFSCYFGLLHSPRHLMDTAFSLGLKSLRSAIAATAPVVAATLGLAALAWGMLSRHSPEQRTLLIVFAGLAALTVPHMVLEAWAQRRLSRGATEELPR